MENIALDSRQAKLVKVYGKVIINKGGGPVGQSLLVNGNTW